MPEHALAVTERTVHNPHRRRRDTRYHQEPTLEAGDADRDHNQHAWRSRRVADLLAELSELARLE
jgi:hypothetical protein